MQATERERLEIPLISHDLFGGPKRMGTPLEEDPPGGLVIEMILEQRDGVYLAFRGLANDAPQQERGEERSRFLSPWGVT